MNVLVAGIGNVFLGDDGFGVAVAERLAREPLPDGARVRDFGIRGLHLAFELMDPPDLLILVDATHQGGAPGTLYVIDPETAPPDAGDGGTDPHGMTPTSLRAAVERMTGSFPRTRIVGCEPAHIGESMELSPPVREAIEPAVEMIIRLIESEVTS
jgi:hydrogenase maturation protease